LFVVGLSLISWPLDDNAQTPPTPTAIDDSSSRLLIANGILAVIFAERASTRTNTGVPHTPTQTAP
jgi:hypothetical protein